MALCSKPHYDLVIVGAGMVGASLACILDRMPMSRPLNILLVESTLIDLNAPPPQPSFDARSTVLSYGTVSYLRELEMWEGLSASAQSITHIHVSDQGRLGSVRMSSREQGVDALGHVIENRLLGSVFNKALAAARYLETRSGVQVTGIKPQQTGMLVTLEKDADSCVVETSLVVLAEGGRSGLCEKMGIHRVEQPYDQEAVIANVAFSVPHKNVAYERFTVNGPLALLPLPDMDGLNRAALVWTRKGGDAKNLMVLSDMEFLDALQKEFGNRLGMFSRVGQRHTYPLSLVAAEEQVRPGLVLLGNVAHSLHPVAGQGFNLAFRDTIRLAAILALAHDRGELLGAIDNLQLYLQQATTDQERTAAFSDYMTRLFSTNHLAAVWLRKFGLFSIDLVLPLRRAFAQRAMGLADTHVKLDTRAS
jgi:2-octaprenyl-6-methoxyphenol hydroxylase